MKKVSLSVGEFALPAPLKGSIDVNSGFARSTQLGMEIHQRVQKRRAEDHANYQAEVAVKHTFEAGGFAFEVCGRMDGIFTGSQAKIEEIKSTFNVYELGKRLRDTMLEHPYCLQLLTYGYFHWLKEKEVPGLSFHLVSTRNFDSQDLELSLNVESYESWLKDRLAVLVKEAKAAEKRAQRRRNVKLAFPFPGLGRGSWS
jgi:DNA excision repair protein ERCC-2